MTEEKLPHPFATGPYLQTAVICERVLEEKDGVKTAIRMFDRTTQTAIGPSPPKEMTAFNKEFTILIRFKSGSARGPIPLRLDMVKPSGELGPAQDITVNFEGEEDRGVDLVMPVQMTIDMAGLYWFDVYLDDVRITRMPLRVVYMPQTLRRPKKDRGN